MDHSTLEEMKQVCGDKPKRVPSPRPSPQHILTPISLVAHFSVRHFFFLSPLSLHSRALLWRSRAAWQPGRVVGAGRKRG